MTTKVPQLRAGEQLACETCSTKVVVVTAPADGAAEITCGGTTLQPAKSVTQPGRDGSEPGVLIGKRYVNAEETVELLCTAAGSGPLTCDGTTMTIKTAKALPASD
ncbi:hypothetical protein GTV32_10800 [Gordonia sp. SID5947]|uniref:hypothetical protein n=1 Tax=Gordonia sp. SID5947 TaxID=2690315 RepID=UPI00136DE5BB|nr:hypothetical protein [Gordonia sp. SID5947]MYR06762.1 hypothetical protein [Gordonia sp. SID5947]